MTKGNIKTAMSLNSVRQLSKHNISKERRKGGGNGGWSKGGTKGERQNARKLKRMGEGERHR